MNSTVTMHGNASASNTVETNSNSIGGNYTASTSLTQSIQMNSSTSASTVLTSSAGESPLLSVPVALPLPGLTTLPLALCAVGGSGNLNGPGIIQAGNGLFNQQGIQAGGIILLNVPGSNNSNLSSLSQIVACSNQAQQHSMQQQSMQQQVIGSNSVNVQAAMQVSQQTSFPQVQAQPTALSNAGLSQMMMTTNQMQLQAPVIPQGSTTAYMLLPIHQLPGANQSTSMQQQQQMATNVVGILPQQNAPQTNTLNTQILTTLPSTQATLLEDSSNKQQQLANLIQSSSASNLQKEQFHQVFSSASSASITTPSSFHQLLNNSQSAALSVSNSVPSAASIQHIQSNSLPRQNLGILSTESSTCPINDPQISSSVPPTSKDLTSFLAPAVMSEIQKLCELVPYNQFGVEHKLPTARDIAAEIMKSTFSSIAATSASPVSISPTGRIESVAAIDSDNRATPTVSSEQHKMEITQTPPPLSSMSSSDSSARTSQSTPATSQTVTMDQTASLLPASNNDSCKPLVTREKRKKGPAPKLDGNEQCLICKDKASGYHYGVLSCEGCKGFFRRSIIKNSNYKCKGDEKCLMDTYMRRKCQYCRLSKCRLSGMKDESVLSEVNGGSKAKRIKKESPAFSASPLHFAPNLSFNGEPIPNLTSQQRNLVEMLQANETRFQWPTQEDVERVTPWIESGDSHRCRASRFAHFTELAILIVQLVVEFTKQLPGFLTVSREDQILLLKACTIEVMLLRAAKQYDKKSKAINFLNGKFYDRSSFYRAGMQVEFVDPIFDFCNSMAKLNLDEAEYALLVAINTFSADRPNLKDLYKVESVQDSYVELLRVYLKIHRPDDPLMFPRTLMKLVELRTLNNYHSEQIFALKVQDKQLPPLLAEIWDM